MQCQGVWVKQRLWLQSKEANPLCSDIPHSGNWSLATALVSAFCLSELGSQLMAFEESGSNLSKSIKLSSKIP